MDARELATNDDSAVCLELDGVHIGPLSSYVLDIRGLAVLNSGADIEGPIQGTVRIKPGDASGTGPRHTGETAPDQDLSGRVNRQTMNSPPLVCIALEVGRVKLGIDTAVWPEAQENGTRPWHVSSGQDFVISLDDDC